MSDAQTHIARDKERAKKFGEFLRSLVKYLENPTAENFENTRAAAKATDDVGLGYHGGQTQLEKNLAELARKLLAGDRAVWEKLLIAAANFDSAKALCRLSPFKGSKK